MPRLHETMLGRKFFERDVPELIKGINRLADALEKLERKEESDMEHLIGKGVRANNTSLYEGLTGIIFDIKSGEEKDTDNPGDDIYVSFNPPTEKQIKHIEERLKKSFSPDATFESLGALDEVIMDISMLDFI